MPAPIDPRQNHLLAALPQAVYQRLLPNLEQVPMPLGEIIYASGDELQSVYFPTTCIVSLVYVMANGASAEIAVTVCDGLVGVALFLGGQTTPNQAVVQVAGQAYRITAKLMNAEFDHGGPLQHRLLLYTQALLAQMAQTAVCNRHHSLDQQLCRWLLLSLDRLRSGEFGMTQELIANMLGVRRQGVVQAAGNLQKAGLIEYRRVTSPCSTAPGWKHGSASVIPSSSANTTVC